MFPWLRRFFTDETRFVGVARGAILCLGALIATDQIPIPEQWDWIGALMMGIAGAIRSSSSTTAAQIVEGKNPRPVKP